MPSQFEDSTHQLWHCETVDGPMVLKVCGTNNIQKSVFWQGMNSLFNAGFPESLGDIQSIYHYLNSNSLISVPVFVAAERKSFVLAKWINGETVSSEKLTEQMIIQLAEYLSHHHQQIHTSWGPFHQAEFSAEQWPVRLKDTLKRLAEHHPSSIPENILNFAVEQAKGIRVEKFMLIMPDLRWDQFLTQQNKLTALVDLDAIVLGPRELELVLLEYLLDADQADLFKQHYQQQHSFPDLSKVRDSYRLLLFLMNVLGEKNITTWLQHKDLFSPTN
jgi:aminoglycoside phosphotransferase (APT) family kinase protein